MVVIPKTKVSTIKNKESHDLSSTYTGTTNFGVVFPSFAREMMPKAKFKMSVNSKILNAPMPVPTFGNMFLNHKHVFVPYVDICPQYYSFSTGQSYTIPGGTSYVPTQLPYCDLPLIAQWCLSYFADFTIYKAEKQLDSPTYDEPTKYKPLLFERGYNQEDLETMKDVFQKIWQPEVTSYFYGKSMTASGDNQNSVSPSTRAVGNSFSDAFNMMPLAPILRNGYGRNVNSLCGRWLAGQFSFNGDRIMSLYSDFWKFNGNVPVEGVDISTGGMWQPSEGYVDILTADYVSLFGPVNSPSEEYVIAFKLRSTAKHFFNILVGLGYQFTPNLEGLVEPDNWLKILAFYKSWFNIYRPKRQMSFTSTYCYKFIKELELEDADSVIYPSDYHLSTNLQEFLWDLATEPYYYLPQDYFGMSTLSPNMDYSEDGGNFIPTYTTSVAPNFDNEEGVYLGDGIPSVNIESVDNVFTNSPAVMKIALGLLKHINKNTIVGKSIADFIKVHFGVSIDSSHDLDKVYLIGEVSEDIDISPVMSMAQTEGDDLGAYAGRGYGESSKGNEFEFENSTDLHGVWITLSCVIPKSGYYQGIMRENRSLKRFDFPQSDLDALGYEVLSRSEVSSDYPVCTTRFNPHSYSDFDRKKGFGLVPRQSFIKVGRDVVAGEIALRSGVAQFDGYHLNRKIPYETINYSSLYDSEGNAEILTELYAPRYIPNVVHDEFRRIDPSDRLGNYNRIFYSESVNDDHFIVGFKFKVEAWMPLLSLSKSFDTEQANTDDVNIVHS